MEVNNFILRNSIQKESRGETKKHQDNSININSCQGLGPNPRSKMITHSHKHKIKETKEKH